jgi:hypothetical protein
LSRTFLTALSAEATDRVLIVGEEGVILTHVAGLEDTGAEFMKPFSTKIYK